MSNRRRAREYVLKALYAFEQGGQTSDDIRGAIIEKSGLDSNGMAFASLLYDNTVHNIAQIDKYINKLATNWKLERIAIVDKNIIRMAICEVEYMPDIPIKVAINEAIELAKKYSTLESASFVNGILDRVLHEKEGK
jgi:transcription antitermination factor NusB